MIKKKEFIPSLTGIRAIAVYGVFIKHFNVFSPELHPGAYLFLNQFHAFLTFFFVLSGFVICHKYYEIRSLHRKQVYNYFVNRISRVFPILFVLITITFLLLHFRTNNHTDIAKTYFYNVTLLKGFSSEYYLTGIGPTWSMSVEELFYALSPFLFFYITKPGRLINFVFIFYLLGVIITFIFSHLNADGFFSDYQFTFYVTFFGRVFEFACGIYLALIVRSKLNNKVFKKIGSHATLIGVILICIFLILQYLTADYYHVNSAIDTIPGLILNNICMPAAIIIFFYGLIYGDSSIKTLLGSGIMTALGNASYSFYLLHTSFVLNLITKFVSSNILVIFIIMIVISLCTYRFFEQPITIYLRKKFSMK